MVGRLAPRPEEGGRRGGAEPSPAEPSGAGAGSGAPAVSRGASGGARAMHSLAQEIRSFSRANLRKQRTRVTTLTGRRIIETWRGACLQVEEEEAAPGGGGGYVQDLSADLQVGVVKPWLLLGEWGRAAAERLLPPGRGSAEGVGGAVRVAAARRAGARWR